jgi:hypothetical protein
MKIPSVPNADCMSSSGQDMTSMYMSSIMALARDAKQRLHEDENKTVIN